MYGYVRPPLGKLPKEEQARFRAAYCGLCRTLGKRYGLASRFILNYDFTFLAILLSDGRERDAVCVRCPAHPLTRRPCIQPDGAMELAADESVILAYWQLQDGAADHGPLRGLKYRGAAKALEGAYRKAAAVRPGFDQRVRSQLGRLAELERKNCPSLDEAADTFASLLAGAAGEMDDSVRRRVLEQLLYHLGRWIYLVDAADDLKQDAREGNYNPVALRYGLTGGVWTPESRHEFAQTLDHSIHTMAADFELLDFGCWRRILESTLYTGLFYVGGAVLDGTFQSAVRNRKKHKNVEEAT